MRSATDEDRTAVFRHPDLRRYIVARFVVATATQVQTVAVGWQVFSATGDPFDLGLVALSQFLPFILLILPAGHVADRYDRRRIQLITYALLAVCALALLALTLAGVTDLAPIFGVMAVFGIARAFSQPTGQALLPNLAPIELFPRAVAVNSSLWQIATIAGPAVGGVLVLFGVGVAYAVALVLLVLGVVLIAGLRGGGRQERSDEPVSWSTLLSGVTFVRSRPIVLGSISLDLFAVLFGGATALLPLYAGEILDVGPVGLGVMRAAPAVGAALVGAVVAALADPPSRRQLDVRRGRRVRRRDDRLRPVDEPGAEPGCAGRDGCRRHGERLHPAPARPARDARRDPRAGERGEQRLHRCLERARRVRVGSHGVVVGNGALRRDRRGGDPGGDRRLDVALPGPAAPRPVPPCGRRRPRGIGARIGRVIDPVAFTIGPIQVHWYGILIAAAALVGTLLATRVARWLGEDPEEAWSMLLVVMAFAILGARLYHVIHMWDHYIANPIEIPQVWNGGIGIPGGIAGGALGVLVYTRSRGLNTARWLDIAAPALLLGQAIGRLGNFVNQELYGPPTTLCGVDFPPCLPFGIPIDATHRAGTQWDSVTYPVETTQFVPLFAYEAILNAHRCRGPALRHSPLRPSPVRGRRGAALHHVVRRRAHRPRAVPGEQLDDPRPADRDVARHHRVRPRAGMARHSPSARVGLADDPARGPAKDRCARAPGAGGAQRWLTGRASCPM